ncbi:MAG: non-hydrolyzing UDP-N-acetylglucosamine 2-epimerase [Sphingomonadaceae bacterium]
MKILSVFGTRPEAIKMAPLVKALAASPTIEARICVTGQHRDMLDQVLSAFAITPDIDLNVMVPGQTPQQICSAVMAALAPILDQMQPDLILVHGDTTTSMAASLAAFFARIPVGHVEAGLRTGDMQSPWPEEANRRITGVIADLHFAPTQGARANLRSENVDDAKIWVTGNTVIDAQRLMIAQLSDNEGLSAHYAQHFGLDATKRLILVTTHRRETIWSGLDQICSAIASLAQRGDCQFVIPVHPNPEVTARLHRHLGAVDDVHLITPQPYLPFVYLMNRAHIILTDSGGVQEEAPALGTPVLVLRDRSERPEAIDTGAAKLVGTDIETIMTETTHLLDNNHAYAVRNIPRYPFGTGGATQAIMAVLENYAWSRGP